jgi:putative flippase GtrA
MRNFLTKTYSQNKKTFIKFLLVGTLNTIVGYGLYTFLLYMNIYYLVALTASHIIATTHSYLWNKYFTFKSTNKAEKEMPRFILVYAFIYFLNLILLFIFVNILRVNPLVSQLTLLGVIALVSFSGQRLFTFRGNF